MVLSAIAPSTAHARCAEPNLLAPITEFQSIQSSRIDALLRFGETQDLCFGVQYVDPVLLKELTDIRIQGGTVTEAIKSILGQERPLSIEVRDNIIEIQRKAEQAQAQSIFDYIIPIFEVKRASVQEISNALHMQLVVDLNPQVTGFAGSYPTGDLKDEVGPFREYNRSLRYLLNAVLASSKGGSWIARVAWGSQRDFKVPERHRVWTFVQYGVPRTGYGTILGEIARDLEDDSHLHQKSSSQLNHPRSD